MKRIIFVVLILVFCTIYGGYKRKYFDIREEVDKACENSKWEFCGLYYFKQYYKAREALCFNDCIFYYKNSEESRKICSNECNYDN